MRKSLQWIEEEREGGEKKNLLSGLKTRILKKGYRKETAKGFINHSRGLGSAWVPYGSGKKNHSQ